MTANIIIFTAALITPALSNSIIHEYTEYCVPPYGYYYPNHTNPNYTLIYSVEPLRPIERCCPECNHCKHLGGYCILKWAYYIYPKCCDFYPIEPCKDYSCVCCIRCGEDKCSPCVQTGGECRVECRTGELEDKTNQCSYYNDGSGCKCCKKCEANYECIEAYGICATDPEWCPYGTYASTGCCGGCYCCKPVWTPVIGGQCDYADGAYCSETYECAPGYYPCFGECFASYYSGGHTRIEQGYCCVPKNKAPPGPTNQCPAFNKPCTFFGIDGTGPGVVGICLNDDLNGVCDVPGSCGDSDFCVCCPILNERTGRSDASGQIKPLALN